MVELVIYRESLCWCMVLRIFFKKISKDFIVVARNNIFKLIIGSKRR